MQLATPALLNQGMNANCASYPKVSWGLGFKNPTREDSSLKSATPYFDMCSLQRPLDTKTQIRVAVEAEAILNVISLWEAGQFELVSSQALMFEAEQITPSPRKAYILEALSKADLFLQPNKQIEERAQVFVNSGIKPLDALHLAFSVEAEANYFCTCDDRFLRRAKEVDTLQTKVVSPLELITELSQ